MRIIYLHQYFNTPEMSGSTRSYEMARRWAETHEVVMVTTDRAGVSSKRGWGKSNVDGIEVHALPVPYSNEMGYRRRIVSFLRFAIAAGRKAVKLRGDIVLATSTPLTIALPGIYASRRLGIPMVLEVRDLWPEIPIAIGAIKNPIFVWTARKLERWAYTSAAHIVALSPDMQTGILAAGHADTKVSVVTNAADLDVFSDDGTLRDRFFASHPHLQGKPLVVYCGAFGKINGVAYLAQIAHEMQLRGTPVNFLAVGGGREEGLIRSTARDLKVWEQNFWMKPRMSKREVSEVFAAATVCTSLCIDAPRIWSNSANKFFDALAAGKPIMINYGGWQAEVIDRHGVGLVVPPAEAESAAARLDQFLADEASVAEAGRNARALAESAYDRDLLSSQFLDILEKTRNEFQRKQDGGP